MGRKSSNYEERFFNSLTNNCKEWPRQEEKGPFADKNNSIRAKWLQALGGKEADQGRDLCGCRLCPRFAG